MFRKLLRAVGSLFRPSRRVGGTVYFVEIRFMNPFKQYYKGFMRRAWRSAGIHTLKRPVPHITVISPFRSHSQAEIIEAFETACKNTGKPLHVALKAPGVFPENNVVFIGADLSDALLSLQMDLYHKFSSITKLGEFDKPSNYHPHLTVWYHMTPTQYNRMKQHVLSQRNLPRYSGNNVRITLLRNSLILREFDVQSGRIMTREDSVGKMIRRRGTFKR